MPTCFRMHGQLRLPLSPNLTDHQGILHDPCEPNCGEDGVSFKGIFNRNLAQLELIDGDPRFIHFLQTNAVAVWTNARTPEDGFSATWSGPPSTNNAGSQASALDALTAATAVFAVANALGTSFCLDCDKIPSSKIDGCTDGRPEGGYAGVTKEKGGVFEGPETFASGCQLKTPKKA